MVWSLQSNCTHSRRPRERAGDAVKVCKVNVETNNEIASKYDIRAIPTILIFKDGAVADTVVGLTSLDDLKAKLA